MALCKQDELADDSEDEKNSKRQNWVQKKGHLRKKKARFEPGADWPPCVGPQWFVSSVQGPQSVSPIGVGAQSQDVGANRTRPIGPCFLCAGWRHLRWSWPKKLPKMHPFQSM